MSREISFKGKRIDNSEWVEGYLFDNGFLENKKMFVGGFVIEKYRGAAADDWDVTGIDFYEVDPETICQYTGLTDKNGKKIWENDIVKDDVAFGSVVWDEHYTQFMINDVRYDENQEYTDWWNGVEVIGNIFDNPELLEQED